MHHGMYIDVHRLFHLHSFTASQLLCSDRGWVLNRAQRKHSRNAPLETRHGMTRGDSRGDSRDVRRKQKDVQIVLFFLFSFDFGLKQKRRMHRVGNSTGLLRPGSWWIVMCSIQRSRRQRMQGPWKGPCPLCLCGVSTTTWISDFISMFAQMQRWNLPRSTTANA